ncbi:MAG: hypothetical protein OXF41_19165 [bacterium]|nr:hypothetical protein [bacterium]
MPLVTTYRRDWNGSGWTMKAGSVNRFEAWALIVGPVLALLFFLLQPGGLLIDSVDSTDYIGRVQALASNATMAHVAGLMVPLGLIVMIYGLTGLNRLIVLVEDDTASALSRFGILTATMGAFGWIMSNGLTHVLVETQIRSEQALQAAVATAQTAAGLTFIASIAVSLGIMALSLGLSARDPIGFNKIAALVIFVVSGVSVIALIAGQSGPNEDMITLARLCYFPWVLWSITLGVRFLKAGSLSRQP